MSICKMYAYDIAFGLSHFADRLVNILAAADFWTSRKHFFLIENVNNEKKIFRSCFFFLLACLGLDMWDCVFFHRRLVRKSLKFGDVLKNTQFGGFC